MGGCCHDAGFTRKEAEVVAKDPVCGKKIDCDDRQALKLRHGDVLYYFCSTLCMTRFINNPKKYGTTKHNFFGNFLKG